MADENESDDDLGYDALKSSFEASRDAAAADRDAVFAARDALPLLPPARHSRENATVPESPYF